jgi:sialic acid synthase SpsE
VTIIAEAACEHRGDFEEAKRLVRLAKEAGADIVKFQLHLPDEEMIPGSIRFWAGSMDEILSQVNLSPGAHRELMRYCEEVGIQYLCTPYCSAAADVLDTLGLQAFKLGSGEMTNLPMLRHIARKGKPMIVSTGMATTDEVEETITALRSENAKFMLMHCTSAYPPRYDQINLRFIPHLREKFDVLVGYSDHTPEIWTALGAVAVGAKVIEKHFTPDRALKGPDCHVSLEPQEFRTMVEAIRKLEAALGCEKRIYPEEETVRRWAHHSVVCLQDIPAGAVITPDMIGVKRPGSGVPAKHLEDFYGRIAQRNIPANSLLQWDDVKGNAT